MLVARSVGSIGMTLPAFLESRELPNRSAGQGAGAEVPNGHQAVAS
jgi:hypothetical protein